LDAQKNHNEFVYLKFKRKAHALAKNFHFPAEAAMAPVKTFASSCGPNVPVKLAMKGWEATDTHIHFGENLGLTNLRKTLLKLKEEVDVCLERLESAVDGLLGSGLKFVDV
jgi:hypothetical protein